MFKKILVCIDGSERSVEAARVGAGLAKVHGAALTLLHVFQLPAFKEPFPGAPTFAVPLLLPCVVYRFVASIRRTHSQAGELVQVGCRGNRGHT